MQNSFKRVINSAIISIPDILKMKYRRGIANKRNEETIDNTIIPLLFFFNLHQATLFRFNIRGTVERFQI